MLVVLCDLIADISMHLPRFPVEAGSLHRLSYLGVGPGGACSAAIMAARFGLPVTCLGEVGDDLFGDIVRNGLVREGIDTKHIQVTANTATPVAGVIVDAAAEPAYLGIAGGLTLTQLPDEWHAIIDSASAVYADGWAEHPSVPAILLAAFARAAQAGITVYFDPGPGNPDLPDDWMMDAITHTRVLLVNEAEALRLSGRTEIDAAATDFLNKGPALVVVKRGALGCILYRAGERVEVPGLTVSVGDQTGAGDRLSAAVIHASLNGYALEDTGLLGNATGAAKVAKPGTGHNMPTLDEIRAVLTAHNYATEIVPTEH